MPHLIVRTESGPVTVLLLTHEKRIEATRRFEEQGFVGTFVPAPQGVIAVLGRDASVERVSHDLVSALSWESAEAR